MSRVERIVAVWNASAQAQMRLHRDWPALARELALLAGRGDDRTPGRGGRPGSTYEEQLRGVREIRDRWRPHNPNVPGDMYDPGPHRPDRPTGRRG
ncbi:MAG: hypothetical protein V4515_14500 [Chloroflexota bacterium]